MIVGSSTSKHSLKSLVGIRSRGQDFLDEAVIRSNTSDSDNRLNSKKQEAVTIPVALIVAGKQIWFAITDLISAILGAKNCPKSIAN